MKSLSFEDAAAEERYQCHYRNVTAEYVCWAAILGALIMLGFSWQDSLISSEGYIATRIRIFGAIPISLMVYLAGKSIGVRRFITSISVFFWISYTCFVVAIFRVYEPGPFGLASSIGLGSLCIIIFGVFAFSNLQFWTSLLVGLVILSIYTVSVARWTTVVLPDFIAGDFLTLFVLILGGAIKSLLEERARRRQFETSELLLNSYAMVEQQVQERTAELRSKNTQLSMEIFERMAVEEKLRGSECRFRTFFEKNTDGIVIINPITLCLEDANSAALDILRCTADEVTGKHLADFTPEYQSDGRVSQDAIRTAINITQQQGFNHFEFIKQSPHRAPFHTEIVQTWIDDGVTSFILATWRDITDRRQLEQQLFQAQKMESIGRLAGGIAHDFNNKLSVIMGYAELSRQELPDDSDVQGYLHEIKRAAEYSRDITSKLLAFSWQQIVLPRRIDANSIIGESISSLSRLIGNNIKIEFVPFDYLWAVRIDPVQVDQIVMNLALNARDAMPDGGVLTIQTSNYLLEESGEIHSLNPAGEYVCIAVTDGGSGMDTDTIKHIFEPFYTTKDVGKGTGLGLATIHGITLQNKGFIEVESCLGCGTTFRIYLPRHYEATEDMTRPE